MSKKFYLLRCRWDFLKSPQTSMFASVRLKSKYINKSFWDGVFGVWSRFSSVLGWWVGPSSSGTRFHQTTHQCDQSADVGRMYNFFHLFTFIRPKISGKQQSKLIFSREWISRGLEPWGGSRHHGNQTGSSEGSSHFSMLEVIRTKTRCANLSISSSSYGGPEPVWEDPVLVPSLTQGCGRLWDSCSNSHWCWCVNWSLLCVCIFIIFIFYIYFPYMLTYIL